MKQERAGRTRRALLAAAATEFDRHGYAGTSLAGVARAAGISIGALTFHFTSKQHLSRAVREQGIATTRTFVADTVARREPPLQYVVALTVALAELMEKDASVRAAARLAREAYDDQHSWESTWVPLIGERLRETGGTQSCPAADPAALSAMAVHLVRGVEASLRHPDHPDHSSNSAMLARIWRLVPCAATPGRHGDA